MRVRLLTGIWTIIVIMERTEHQARRKEEIWGVDRVKGASIRRNQRRKVEACLRTPILSSRTIEGKTGSGKNYSNNSAA